MRKNKNQFDPKNRQKSQQKSKGTGTEILKQAVLDLKNNYKAHGLTIALLTLVYIVAAIFSIISVVLPFTLIVAFLSSYFVVITEASKTGNYTKLVKRTLLNVGKYFGTDLWRGVKLMITLIGYYIISVAIVPISVSGDLAENFNFKMYFKHHSLVEIAENFDSFGFGSLDLMLVSIVLILVLKVFAFGFVCAYSYDRKASMRKCLKVMKTTILSDWAVWLTLCCIELPVRYIFIYCYQLGKPDVSPIWNLLYLLVILPYIIRITFLAIKKANLKILEEELKEKGLSF